MKKLLVISVAIFTVIVAYASITELIDRREFNRLSVELHETRKLQELIQHTNEQVFAEEQAADAEENESYFYYANYAHQAFLGRMFAENLEDRQIFEDVNEVMYEYSVAIGQEEIDEAYVLELTEEFEVVHERAVEEHANMHTRVNNYVWSPFNW